jgi:hypothetical protein
MIGDEIDALHIRFDVASTATRPLEPADLKPRFTAYMTQITTIYKGNDIHGTHNTMEAYQRLCEYAKIKSNRVYTSGLYGFVSADNTKSRFFLMWAYRISSIST